MRLLRFFVFILILSAMVFVGNILVEDGVNIGTQGGVSNLETSMSYNAMNIIEYDGSKVKSMARLSLNSQVKYLSEFFNVSEDSVNNMILKKKIRVLNSDGDIIVFVGPNGEVLQITLLLEGNLKNSNLKTFKSTLLENAKVHNMPALTEIIGNDEEGIFVKIVSYDADEYTLEITDLEEMDRTIFTIDIINNNPYK